MDDQRELLFRALKRIDSSSKRRSYILEMWHEALGARTDPNPSLRCNGAFPYVPLSIVSHGLTLTDATRVLDVGCLGGYGMYDFIHRCASAGYAAPEIVGVDVDDNSIEIGRSMKQHWDLHDRVSFVQASGETMPFEDGSFDLIIHRLVMPYLRVRDALTELARVLKRGGLALIQLHNTPYYWQSFLRHLWVDQRQAAYYLRAIVAGVVFRRTGFQAQHRWFSEVAMSAATLRPYCAARGLEQVWHRQEETARPLLVFRKTMSATAR